MNGSPWTAWVSSFVSKVQAKLSATGVVVVSAGDGDGEAELERVGVAGFEQLASTHAEATRKRKRQPKEWVTT